MTRGQSDTLAILREADERLAERPGDDAAHERRARALLALGRLDEAEHAASAAVRLDPEEIRYRELLAEVLSARGAHHDAATEYARLAHNDPRQRDWTLAEAGERLDADEAGRAVAAARRAVRLDPDDADAQLALSRSLAAAGDGAGALRAAVVAAGLRPNDLAAREALADARWLADQDAAAFAEFRALAGELSGGARERVVEKARRLYLQHAGPLGRLLAALPALFAFALSRGWLRVT
ncbi:MAG TPA: tetratricopeptide repeat protein [Candidatus Limnocylindria bacterium]